MLQRVARQTTSRITTHHASQSSRFTGSRVKTERYASAVPDVPFSVDAFTATFEGVRLPIGLVVQSLTLTGSGVEIATHPIGVSVTSPARFEATVDEASIIAFLTSKAPGGLKE